MTDEARKEQPPIPEAEKEASSSPISVMSNGEKSQTPASSPSPADGKSSSTAVSIASAAPSAHAVVVPPAPVEVKEPMAPAASASSATSDLQSMRVTRQISDITNNKCPTCGLVNRVGVLVCEDCGTSLLSGATSVPSTRSLQDKGVSTGQLSTDRVPADRLLEIEKLPLSVPRVETRSIFETAQSGVTEDTILKLEIPGAPQPLMVLPKREVMIGRKDLTTGTLPDLDLTPFAGYRMGVSRRHAMFRMYDRRIEVVDLGSSNGSRLNGILMHAHQPYLLRDGDLLTLGKLEMRVSFHQPPPRITRV